MKDGDTEIDDSAIFAVTDRQSLERHRLESGHICAILSIHHRVPRAEVFWEILDTRFRTTAVLSHWVGWNENAICYTSLDVEGVINFVKLVIIVTFERCIHSTRSAERFHDLGIGIRLLGGGEDSGSRKVVEGRQCLEDSNDLFKESDYLFLRMVIRKAVRVKCGVACAVFAPLHNRHSTSLFGFW